MEIIKTKNTEAKQRLLSLLLTFIPTGQSNAITSRELTSLTGIKFRYLKLLIAELRNDYPICSKETNGGGYWIADNDMDVKEFINMISRRRNGYNKTINIMQNHIGKEVDC